eukprot:scaffold5060_cov123-Isochrysis_galbana.AAC.7
MKEKGWGNNWEGEGELPDSSGQFVLRRVAAREEQTTASAINQLKNPGAPHGQPSSAAQQLPPSFAASTASHRSTP